jgi:hypothetical protein
MSEYAIIRSSIQLNLRGFARHDTRGKIRELQARLHMTDACERAQFENIALQSVGEQENRTYLEEDTQTERIAVQVAINYTAVYHECIQTIGTGHSDGEDQRGNKIVDMTVTDGIPVP